MSFNRDNVVWQSEDGTWSRGFFGADVYGDDPEWDVEYDYQRFEWASTGHRTERSAEDSWHGANPGMHTIWLHAADPDRCRNFDGMAQALKARVR